MQLVVFKIALEIKKKEQVNLKARIQWWKLKHEECCAEFREELIDDWESADEETAKVFGLSSGQRKEDKETGGGGNIGK